MMNNADRLDTLTATETKIYWLILNNPMLSIYELAGLQGCHMQTLKNHLGAIYAKLIPEDVYNRASFTKRGLYVHLRYGKSFRDMSDSWRATFIDPTFSTKV